jgi:hypothetical protein
MEATPSFVRIGDFIHALELESRTEGFGDALDLLAARVSRTEAVRSLSLTAASIAALISEPVTSRPGA